MFVNTLLGKCTVSVKTQVRSDQWCPGKTREWGQGGAWVKYWKRMDKPGGGEARRALLVKWSVHRLRGMTQGGIWTLHCASDSTWLKNKERRCWELQSEKQKRQKKQRLCATGFTLDTRALIRVNQRPCRYLLTVVRTDLVCWRDVSLEVGEMS